MFVKLEDTIKGFKGIVAGEYDDLPESAFYMVGTIEEAVGKGAQDGGRGGLSPMADKLQFELVSPEKLLLSEQVGMVVVPGTEGNFGVLPGHALFISTVRPGVIDVYEDGLPTISERIFVAGGFAEVTPERCTVLADEAVPLSALDRAALESRERARSRARPRGLTDQVAALADDEREDAVGRARHGRAPARGGAGEARCAGRGGPLRPPALRAARARPRP